MAIPEWLNSGVEPSDTLRNSGFRGGTRANAEHFNWFFHTVINELNRLADDAGIKLTLSVGTDVTASGDNSVAVGEKTTASGKTSFAGGYNNTANAYNTVIGKNAKSPTATSPTVNTGDLFVIGSGIEGGAKSNALRVTAASEVMGTTAYAATGADIAHNMEWLDGNPNNEDRRGLFVTTVGKKIRVANSSDDYILGVISATPSLICNANTDDWRGKYVTDEYGARVMKDGAYILSDEFDESLDNDYANCLDRPEKANVGHSGIVIARDDGTCVVDGYCLPNDNGVATKAQTGYRVLERLSENRIQIFVSAPLIINK